MFVKNQCRDNDLCSSQGSPEKEDYPGVHSAVVPHRSISNSVVKRSSGDDSWGVAPCESSTMPGKNLDSDQQTLVAALRADSGVTI